MSGPSGTWTTTSGGGPDIGTILALIAAAVAFAATIVVVQAVEAIPIYVWVLAVAGVTTGAVLAARRHRRRTAEVTAQFAAIRAEREAAEEAAAVARHQRKLAELAASAPVINNHVWTPEAIEAMRRGHAPTAIVADAEEIQR